MIYQKKSLINFYLVLLLNSFLHILEQLIYHFMIEVQFLSSDSCLIKLREKFIYSPNYSISLNISNCVLFLTNYCVNVYSLISAEKLNHSSFFCHIIICKNRIVNCIKFRDFGEGVTDSETRRVLSMSCVCLNQCKLFDKDRKTKGEGFG